MEPMAGAGDEDRGLDHARCEFCGHEHACYVGGSYRAAPGSSVDWERHVCLGCLMRASSPRGFESCADCNVGPRATSAGSRDA